MCRSVYSDLFAFDVNRGDEPSVAQLVERLTVVLNAVYQCARKSIGRWFDSGHSDLCCGLGLPALFCASASHALLAFESHGSCVYTSHCGVSTVDEAHWSAVVSLAASVLPCCIVAISPSLPC